MSVVVQITEYEDDYKHRYDNGVCPKNPKLFKSKKQAQKYVNEYIYESVNEYFIDHDRDMKDIDKKYKKYIGEKG